MATEYILEGKFVRCNHDGSFALEEFRATARAAAAYCRENECKNLLLDFSCARGELSFHDRYQLGEESTSIIGFSMRAAVYGRFDQVHPDKIGELVARNRGAQVRVFTDLAEAERWILTEEK